MGVGGTGVAQVFSDSSGCNLDVSSDTGWTGGGSDEPSSCVAPTICLGLLGSLIIAFGGGGGRGSEFAACATFLLNSSGAPPVPLVELRELLVLETPTDDVICAGVATTGGVGTCGSSLLPLLITVNSLSMSGLKRGTVFSS